MPPMPIRKNLNLQKFTLIMPVLLLTNGFAGVNQNLCSGFAGVNQGVANGFAQAEISNNARQIANMQQAFAAQTATSQGFNG